MVETAFVHGRACPDMHPGKSVVVLPGEKRSGFSGVDSLEASRLKEESVIDANAAVAVVVVHEERESRLGDDRSMGQRRGRKDVRVGGLVVDIVDIVGRSIEDHSTVDRGMEDGEDDGDDEDDGEGVAGGVENGVVDGVVEAVETDAVAVPVGVMLMLTVVVDVDCVPLDRDPWLWLDII